MQEGVGAKLREVRERRKIGLSEVEASTKIRVRFLQAIEDEEWELLPGDAYARSFIRTYAGYLGLDGEGLVEQHRRLNGSTAPGEELPHVEPEPVTLGQIETRPSRRALATLAVLALIAVLVVIGLSSGDGGSQGGAGSARQEAAEGSGGDSRPVSRAPDPPGLSLELAATAEVWVCLLDSRGEPLVNGQILGEGTEEGPYRSGSFTVSLGNGEVDMTVDGKQASIPETSSPIGFVVGPDGSMRELSEGERPTCT